jgi:hypothetical protein
MYIWIEIKNSLQASEDVIMNKIYITVCSLILCFLCAIASAQDVTPVRTDTTVTASQKQNQNPVSQISYQGYLTDINGSPISGSEDVLISIWNSAAGGIKLWEENHTVDIIRGYFTAELGAKNSFPKELFDGSDRWLQVKVGGEDLYPRKRISSIAYSLHSANSAQLSNHPVEDFVLLQSAQDHSRNTIDASSLGGYPASLYLTRSQIEANFVQRNVPNSVNSSMILDGSIQPQDIGFSLGKGTITAVNTDFGLTGGGADGQVTVKLASEFYTGSAFDDRFVKRQDTKTITSNMIADEQITTVHIKNGSIQETDLAFPAGKMSEIQTGTGLSGGGNFGVVTISLHPNYQNGSAYDERFVNIGEGTSVTGFMIKDESITGADIQDGSIGPSDLSAQVGDVTAVYTGTGLTGGSNQGEISLQLAPSYIDGSVFDSRFVGKNQVGVVTSTMIENGTIQPMDLAFPAGDITSISTQNGIKGGSLSGDVLIQLDDVYANGSAYDPRFVNENQLSSINSNMITDRTILSADLADATIAERHFPTTLQITRGVISNPVFSVRNTSMATSSIAVNGDGYIGVRGGGTVGVKGEGSLYGVHAKSDYTTGTALFVEGKAHCTTGGWADVAEYVYGTNGLESGDVVIIDPDGRNRVKPCEKLNDSRVAGIVSTNPTIMVGHLVDHVDGYPLALNGIVPCKVTAEKVSIRPGDLLTTSNIRGHAIKAVDPKPGTIIGKAMEPLESGRGVINVLVNLQ